MSETIEKRGIAVSVEALVKTADENTVLNNVSFDFEKKGIHGILAPTGSGKSALLDIISLSSGFDEGILTVGNTYISAGDAYSKKAKKLKAKIGYVRQRNDFYPEMTPFEVLNFVGNSRKVAPDKLARQIKEALELVGLEEVQNRLLQKLGQYEHKMLGFACAIIGNPELLIIDEPRLNAAVATDDRKSLIYEIIKLFGRKKTVILATEDYRTARELCEDVVILSDGSLLAKGSFEELDAKLAGGEGKEKITLESLYMSLAQASKAKSTKSIF